MEMVELTQEQKSEEGIGAGQEIVELREHFTEGQLVQQESGEGIGVGQEIVELREHFTEGQLVEVRTRDDLELGDSWFTAKIIKLPDKKADSIFVEYENGPSDLLKSIFVDAYLVRPVQPHDPPNQFFINQIVDAFHGNGWRQGEIIEVHGDSRYTVCFPIPRRQNMDFGQDNLRVHKDWIGGKWVQPQDEDRDIKLDARKSDQVTDDKVSDSSIMQVLSCSENHSDQSLPFSTNSDHIPPSDPQQCSRRTKTWRCNERASPGKIYCDKHQLLRDRYDDKRRKGPKEGSRFKIDLDLPCGQRQCRRGGKRWRCHELAAPGKVYCDKHQLKRDIYNDKRRRGPHKRRHLIMEPLSDLGSGSDQIISFNGDHSTGLEMTRENDRGRMIEAVGRESPNGNSGREQLNSRATESGGAMKKRKRQKEVAENNPCSSELVSESGQRKRKERKESCLSEKEELIRPKNGAVRRKKTVILEPQTVSQLKELSEATDDGFTSKGTEVVTDELIDAEYIQPLSTQFGTERCHSPVSAGSKIQLIDELQSLVPISSSLAIEERVSS